MRNNERQCSATARSPGSDDLTGSLLRLGRVCKSSNITGLHHVAAIASNPQSNLDFNRNGKPVAASGEIIGQSTAWRQIIEQIEMVAPTDATVLIQGETGTGKELIARELHRRSRRKDKPMVAVNCSSIPKDLYESEFFGHTRGAFTSAIRDRVGRFEAAAGGTLLTRLCASKPRMPPRSVVFTDWPSMMTTDGQAVRPACRRACWYIARWTQVQTPPFFQARK
jgi:transcriptional regulator of acetoin/glycerol metabolism